MLSVSEESFRARCTEKKKFIKIRGYLYPNDCKYTIAGFNILVKILGELVKPCKWYSTLKVYRSCSNSKHRYFLLDL